MFPCHVYVVVCISGVAMRGCSDALYPKGCWFLVQRLIEMMHQRIQRDGDIITDSDNRYGGVMNLLPAASYVIDVARS